MAGFAAIMPIFSALGSVFSAVSQSSAASNAAQAQANAANYNAAIARNNAISAEQAAAANARQQARINSAKMGKLQVGLTGSGFTMEGTPLMLIESNAGQLELDKQKILWEGATQAQNYRNQATLEEYKGQVALQAGENQASGAMISGIMGGATTLGKSLLTN